MASLLSRNWAVPMHMAYAHAQGTEIGDYDLAQQISETKIYSQIDLMKAYNELPVAEKNTRLQLFAFDFIVFTLHVPRVHRPSAV